jgi:uncharacterized protein (DUF1786 family)
MTTAQQVAESFDRLRAAATEAMDHGTVLLAVEQTEKEVMAAIAGHPHVQPAWPAPGEKWG